MSTIQVSLGKSQQVSESASLPKFDALLKAARELDNGHEGLKFLNSKLFADGPLVKKASYGGQMDDDHGDGSDEPDNQGITVYFEGIGELCLISKKSAPDIFFKVAEKNSDRFAVFLDGTKHTGDDSVGIFRDSDYRKVEIALSYTSEDAAIKQFKQIAQIIDNAKGKKSALDTVLKTIGKL